MKSLLTSFAVSLVAVVLVGCGKSEPTTNGRVVAPAPRVVLAIDGVWKTKCNKGAQKRVTIAGENYKFENLAFEKADCTGKVKVLNTNEAKVKFVPTTDKGFTHVVTFVETKGGAEYSLRASVAAGSMKFENESDLYLR